MLRRLLLIVACLGLAESQLSAQPQPVSPFPSVPMPVFGLPVQQGSSTNPFTNISFTGQALGPDSCVAYSFTSAPTTGYGYDGTDLCANVGGNTIAKWSTTAFTLQGTINAATTNGSITATKLSLGTTPTLGMAVQNTTVAAAGAQQLSPAVDWVGQGWKTDATAASQEVRFRADVLPAQGTAAPTGAWRLGVLINGGAISPLLSVSPATMDITTGTTQWATFSDASTGLTIGSGYGIGFGATTASKDWNLARNGADIAAMDSGDALQTTGSGYFQAGTASASFRANGSAAYYQLNTAFAINTAPTIASGGCTSPAVTWNNGTAAFLITIGTTCAGVKTVTLTMPGASNLWACDGNNNTSDAAQATNYPVFRATSTTAVVLTSYDRVTGLQEDFTDSDTYLVKCIGG